MATEDVKMKIKRKEAEQGKTADEVQLAGVNQGGLFLGTELASGYILLDDPFHDCL